MKRLLILLTLSFEAACALAQTASSPMPTTDNRQLTTENRQLKTENRQLTTYYLLADSAQYFIGREQWSEASRCIREALRLEPANVGNVMLFSNLGLATGMEGKYGEAIQCFDIALSRAPESIPVLTSKAKIQLLSSDTDGALTTIDYILSLDSMAQWPRQTRGLLRLRQKDFREAYDDFSFLSKKFPENPWGAAGMAKCMEAQGRPTEAAGYYRDAIQCSSAEDEDRVEFQLGLIENLGHSGQLSEALEVAKDAIALHPHEGRLYLLRGWIKQKLLIYREAEADKKLAIDYGVDPQLIEQFLPSQR
ncbi:MAG: tetratricopeptide repeat protein [Muribaculaceae bacterium]|nr:tetratricopeptide repeat protein [Muribaculaceae bacterium]